MLYQTAGIAISNYSYIAIPGNFLVNSGGQIEIYRGQDLLSAATDSSLRPNSGSKIISRGQSAPLEKFLLCTHSTVRLKQISEFLGYPFEIHYPEPFRLIISDSSYHILHIKVMVSNGV